MRAWIAIVVAAAVGCGGEAATSTPSDAATEAGDAADVAVSPVSSDAAEDAVDCCDIVYTPGGPAARACVHEVPNGGSVDIGDGGYSTVTAADGAVVGVFAPCPCGQAQLALCD